MMKPNCPAAGFTGIAAIAFFALSSLAQAEPIKVEAVLSQKESLRLDFVDGSKRYLAMVRREGKATGQGPLVGATATEWGMHDVTPGVGTNSHGYLVFAMPDGDVAYLKTQFRGTSMAGPDGKPMNLLNGSWEVVGASGKLKGLQGAGTLRINAVGPTERQWILDGEMVQVK
jgi:hypothetical protein